MLGYLAGKTILQDTFWKRVLLTRFHAISNSDDVFFLGIDDHENLLSLRREKSQHIAPLHTPPLAPLPGSP